MLYMTYLRHTHTRRDEHACYYATSLMSEGPATPYHYNVLFPTNHKSIFMDTLVEESFV